MIEVIRTVPKDRHLCLEEGPHSNWLYEVLSPSVQEIVVALVNESRGPKNDQLEADSVRVQSRIKALLRSRGVSVSGGDVYSTKGREAWLSKLPQSARSLAELLFLEYDGLEGLRQRAEREMIAEAHKHDV